MDLIEDGGEIQTSSDEDSDEVKSQPSNLMINKPALEHIEHPERFVNNLDLTVSMAKLKEANTFLFGFMKSITQNNKNVRFVEEMLSEKLKEKFKLSKLHYMRAW